MNALFLVFLMFVGFAVAAPQNSQNSPGAMAVTKDTDLGPVVATKREISDLYKVCLNNLTGEIDKPMYAFSCRIPFKMDAEKEVIMTQNPLTRYFDQTCTVEVNYTKGQVVLFFGNPRAPSTLDEAKLCLEKGTDSSQNKLDVLIFKVQ